MNCAKNRILIIFFAHTHKKIEWGIPFQITRAHTHTHVDIDVDRNTKIEIKISILLKKTNRSKM